MRILIGPWQPDRLQQAKHYIFHAHNPVNGLQYGHMAMIAYNKKLVMTNSAEGLDFTLGPSSRSCSVAKWNSSLRR